MRQDQKWYLYPGTDGPVGNFNKDPRKYNQENWRFSPRSQKGPARLVFRYCDARSKSPDLLKCDDQVESVVEFVGNDKDRTYVDMRVTTDTGEEKASENIRIELPNYSSGPGTPGIAGPGSNDEWRRKLCDLCVASWPSC